MSGLAEFLAARYAEDWAKARDREIAAGLHTSRATRDIDAKRAILAEHGPRMDHPVKCRLCITERRGYPEEWSDDDYPCRTVRLLIAIFGDHPDYDEAWKP